MDGGHGHIAPDGIEQRLVPAAGDGPLGMLGGGDACRLLGSAARSRAKKRTSTALVTPRTAPTSEPRAAAGGWASAARLRPAGPGASGASAHRRNTGARPAPAGSAMAGLSASSAAPMRVASAPRPLGDDGHSRPGGGQGLRPGALDHGGGEEPVEAVVEAAQHDDFGVEQVDEVPDAEAEPPAHLGHRGQDGALPGGGLARSGRRGRPGRWPRPPSRCAAGAPPPRPRSPSSRWPRTGRASPPG